VRKLIFRHFSKANIMDRAQIVHENFLRRVGAGDLPENEVSATELSHEKLLELFQSQCLSRQLDRVSRDMQKAGNGFYTIGSSGHEGMAGIAEALRVTDMAFLHYRDAAFQIQRSKQVPSQNMAWDMLLSFAASSDDPISGGRHKVLGSKRLNIPPQTSTIASHLPKAVGAAHSIGLAKRIKPEHQALPDDAIVMCAFGDASSNHSTAQGAINAACWTSFQSVPMPILFVCEDNGIGISTPTPDGWVNANFAHRPGLKYFSCNGLDIVETTCVAKEAAAYVRARRKPAFLHVQTVRLYGHAGSDIELNYRTKKEVEASEANDPLLQTAKILMQTGACSGADAIQIYNEIGETCRELAKKAVTQPRLQTIEAVEKSLVPGLRKCMPSNGPSEAQRAGVFGGDLSAMNELQTMNRLIGWALTDLMLSYKDVVVAGEDVGRKGGVYGVTQKLQKRFGQDRVIDTLLDEQTILGLAIGLGHNGFTPIPEIQFLAYLHNAEDQIRGEAATLSFFSDGQYTNPMVIRIAGLAYQRGFGGHFHNDNSLAVLRDIPGLVIACPSNGHDAVLMLRKSVQLAREEQRIVVFVEPIALYTMRDLTEQGDKAWMHSYPSPDQSISLDDIGINGEGEEIAIVTYGNGYYLSCKAQKELEDQGIKSKVIDIRWLAPLPEQALIAATQNCKSILIVDECRQTGSQSEALITMFLEAGFLNDKSKNMDRLTATDSFIATGPAYAASLPSVEVIIAKVKTLVGV
jgi:2-oxoisovalerate dehydrogenase E1 component